jgi:transposase
VRAYSVDLRERVVAAVNRGMPIVDVADIFQVNRATVSRWINRRRRDSSDSLQPRKTPGRPRHLSGEQLESLRLQLEAHPSATLQEHCQMLAASHGVSVSIATMSRMIRSLGWTRKKKMVYASERDEEQLHAWLRDAAAIDPVRLVFVDECGINIAMTPLYGRAPKGTRAIGHVPRRRGVNVTVIAALSLAGLGAMMTLKGPATTQAFDAYVVHLLAPTLQPAQVVVLDNVRIHKGATVIPTIEACGCSVRFLPPYSEGLAPIDEAFSKLKTALRRAEARSYDALDDALAQAMSDVTPADAAGWFRHCGYQP